MSIHVALRHLTHYRYDRAISLGPQTVRLRPAPHCRTRILSYSMKVLPAKHFINWQQDPQSNHVARLVFPDTTREFRIEVEVIGEMSVINPFDFFLEAHAETYPFDYEAAATRRTGAVLQDGKADAASSNVIWPASPATGSTSCRFSSNSTKDLPTTFDT